MNLKKYMNLKEYCSEGNSVNSNRPLSFFFIELNIKRK